MEQKQGLVIWLTGLPSSGKSTLARGLCDRLTEMGQPNEILDGDEIRDTINADLSFSPEDRREQARRVVYLAKLLSRNGINVIVSLITPYRNSRSFARKELPNYMEVYLRCPLEECARRDPKDLYAKAQKGEILNFTGVSAPYEVPETPEVTLDTDSSTVEECVDQVLAQGQALGHLLNRSLSGVQTES